MSTAAWRPRHISDQSIQFPRRRGDYTRGPHAAVESLSDIDKTTPIFSANMQMFAWEFEPYQLKLRGKRIIADRVGFFCQAKSALIFKKGHGKTCPCQEQFLFLALEQCLV